MPADSFEDMDGDTLTYAATLSDGSELPDWLAFNADTRTFSGTPTNGDAGDINVRVSATDGAEMISDTFAITVDASADNNFESGINIVVNDTLIVDEEFDDITVVDMDINTLDISSVSLSPESESVSNILQTQTEEPITSESILVSEITENDKISDTLIENVVESVTESISSFDSLSENGLSIIEGLDAPNVEIPVKPVDPFIVLVKEHVAGKIAEQVTDNIVDETVSTLSETIPPSDMSRIIGVMNDNNISLPEQRHALAEIGAINIVDGLMNSVDPAAQQIGEVLRDVSDGEDVFHADLIQVMDQHNMEYETRMSNLLAFDIVQKEQRTEMFSQALSELDWLDSGRNVFFESNAIDGDKFDKLEFTEKKVALLIGIDEYWAPIPDLNTAVNDVSAISDVLESKDYQVVTLRDASHGDILKAFRSLAGQVKADQKVLIYFAGHGYLRESTGIGYWIPSDTDPKSAKQWISTEHVSDFLAEIPSKQIMLVSDSCYSGALVGEHNESDDKDRLSIEQIKAKRSVTVMSSGGEEPVMDGGGDGHSVFARQLLNTLEKSDPNSAGSDLFRQVRDGVVESSPQTPQYGAMTSAGHEEGGDFLFNTPVE